MKTVEKVKEVKNEEIISGNDTKPQRPKFLYTISNTYDYHNNANNLNMNGCKERKCPCRMWVNCLYYIDMKRQALRLRNKEYDFHEWYMDNFRSEIEMVDVIANG